MKRALISAIVFAATFSTIPLQAFASDIDISIAVGQPNFYGRIDIGRAPPPQLIYTQPVIVHAPPVVTYVERPAPPAPLYLRVPPGHAKKWSKHCHRYGACGVPVYFVRDRWYQDVYVPHHRQHYVHATNLAPVYVEDYGKQKKQKYDKHDKQNKQYKHEKHDRD